MQLLSPFLLLFHKIMGIEWLDLFKHFESPERFTTGSCKFGF